MSPPYSGITVLPALLLISTTGTLLPQSLNISMCCYMTGLVRFSRKEGQKISSAVSRLIAFLTGGWWCAQGGAQREEYDRAVMRGVNLKVGHPTFLPVWLCTHQRESKGSLLQNTARASNSLPLKAPTAEGKGQGPCPSPTVRMLTLFPADSGRTPACVS